MNIFISMPMAGRSDHDIIQARDNILADIKRILKTNDIVLVGGYYPEKSPLWCLGKSIKELEKADVVVFTLGWEKARGCRIERNVCEEYEIPFIDWDFRGGYTYGGWQTPEETIPCGNASC